MGGDGRATDVNCQACGAQPRSRGWRALAGACLLLGALPGCASGYLSDRGRDVLDVIDLKGGWSMGLGVKAEATLYLGAGLGGASLGDTTEWYGRQKLVTLTQGQYSGGLFVHLLIAGFDTQTEYGGPPSQDSLNVLTVNRVAFSDSNDPPMLERWRFGGEVVLPFVRGGLYLNLGELFDLFAGVVGFDPADDDGLVEQVIETRPADDSAPPAHEPPVSS